MLLRFHKVDDGIYRGSAPSQEDVQFLKDMGIKKIISLDRETGENIKDTCSSHGLNHQVIPLDGTRASLLNLLQHDLKKLLKNGGPVFFHCHYGKDRCGLLAALYRCKFQDQDPEMALKEAYSLGFGVGCDPQFIENLENLIRSSKSKKKTDENNADIVSNVREYKSDYRSSPLDEAHQGSFAPYAPITREWPYSPVYPELMNQPGGSNDISAPDPILQHSKEKKEQAPMVGQYNNAAGINGQGPTFPTGGFIFD